MDHAVILQAKRCDGCLRNRQAGTSMSIMTNAPAATFRIIAKGSSAGSRFAMSSQAIATPDKPAPITRPSFSAWADRSSCAAFFDRGGMGRLALEIDYGSGT